jgi:hypothetical protein
MEYKSVVEGSFGELMRRINELAIDNWIVVDVWPEQNRDCYCAIMSRKVVN